MRRRVFGILAALVLAALGTAALVAYVQSARDDAVADEEPVQVYVVQEAVRQGAPLDDIREAVELADVPVRLKAPDAISDLGTLSSELVAAVELRPGEQLLRSRLVDARSLVRVDVPEGLVELTVALEPQRAVGGVLQPGTTVGIIMSFDPFDIGTTGQPASAEEPAEGATATTAPPTRTPNTTHYTLHKILVTGVQYSRSDSERASEISDPDESTETTLAATVEEAPGDSLLITLAVSAPEAEQIVFAAEFGRIWLTAEGPDASEDGTRILTLGQVYVAVPR